MHSMSASIRFASVAAWEDFSKENDEEAVKEMFEDKGVTVQKGISSTHGMPPIHNVMLNAPDSVEAEDLQSSEFPDGVLVHIEEEI